MLPTSTDMNLYGGIYREAELILTERMCFVFCGKMRQKFVRFCAGSPGPAYAGAGREAE